MPNRTRRWALGLFVIGAFFVFGCGGAGNQAAVAQVEETPPVPGIPKPGDAGWCDPMPELGDACAENHKQCSIACDPEHGICAVLDCRDGKWEYVELGTGQAGDS
ncbi:MAG: hypothetical protein FWD57_02650 [Polyangiaceae bacterium]|nr:hypothetical protein [Polyangiaceae bacterium]